jgi:hypothetical protein
MSVDTQATRLTPPSVFLLRMTLFLALAGFVGLILHRQIWTAFLANPGLNALIFGLCFLGIVYAFAQVIRLFPEVAWVNDLTGAKAAKRPRPPTLLAPVAALLRDVGGARAISTTTLRAMLDSVGMRLDEAREISRYLVGLLVFLGLLGTFWGLIETVGSIGDVIKSMSGGADAAVLFEDLKNGLAKPIAGMSISFTSSLFGLAGSLILGFLDLQAGQAQNRFYTELEDNLSRYAADAPAGAGALADIDAALKQLAAREATSGAQATTAMATLAEGVAGLVKHMRGEQQLVREWMEAQAAQNREIKAVLEQLARERADVWRADDRGAP